MKGVTRAPRQAADVVARGLRHSNVSSMLSCSEVMVASSATEFTNTLADALHEAGAVVICVDDLDGAMQAPLRQRGEMRFACNRPSGGEPRGRKPLGRLAAIDTKDPDTTRPLVGRGPWIEGDATLLDRSSCSDKLAPIR